MATLQQLYPCREDVKDAHPMIPQGLDGKSGLQRQLPTAQYGIETNAKAYIRRGTPRGRTSFSKQPGQVLRRDAGALDTVLVVEARHHPRGALSGHPPQGFLKVGQFLLRIEEEVAR